MSKAASTERRLAEHARDEAGTESEAALAASDSVFVRWAGRLRGVGIPLLGLLVILLLWQFLTSGLLSDSSIVIAFQPRNAFRELVGFFVSGVIYSHIVASLERIGMGLALAVAIGVPIGVIIGHYRAAERASSLAFQFIRMISPLSWMPIAIVVFGVGSNPVIFLIAIAAVWPMIINTAHGVSSLDQRWIRAARTLGANEWKLVRMVILPAVVPDMLTGLRLAVGLAWVVLVPAEMLGVSDGLGYYILDTRDRFNYGELMAVILVIGVIGYALDQLIRFLRVHVSWDQEER